LAPQRPGLNGGAIGHSDALVNHPAPNVVKAGFAQAGFAQAGFAQAGFAQAGFAQGLPTASRN